LPLKPAIALLNYLEAELTLGKNSVKIPRVEFIVTPNEPWDDYQVIMYYPYKPEQQPATLYAGGLDGWHYGDLDSFTLVGSACVRLTRFWRIAMFASAISCRRRSWRPCTRL
jgi:hypothetical protein